MRIRTKLLVPFLALPLGSIAVLGMMAYRGGRQAIATTLGRLFELQAAHGIDALDHEVLARYEHAMAWAANDRMQDVLTDDMDGRVSSFLVAEARTQPHLRRAVVADASGRVVAASHPDWIGTTVPTPAAAARADPRTACQDELAAGDGRSILTCSFPIRAHFDERQLLGSLTVAWELGPVFEQLLAEARAARGQAGLVLLTRESIVASAPPDRPEWAPGSHVAAGSQAAALMGRGRLGHLVEDVGGKPHLVGFAHSSGPTGWSVLVVEDAAVAFAPIDRLRNAVLGVGGGVALLAFVLALIGSGRLTGPLLALEAAARRVAGGDLAVRLEPSSGDEIGSLSRSFDRMVGELAQQRAQLVDKAYVDSLIAEMSDGLFVVDRDGLVLRANPAISRGRTTPDTIVGQPAGALFAEGAEAFRERVLDPARRDGSVTEVELGLRAADGSVVPVIVSAGRLPSAAAAEGLEVVCIATDITHRKIAEAELLQAREAAEAAASAKARFLAAVSHEVRTPLNGVLGVTDLLAATPLDVRQREYVETARRSGQLLLSLLSDILDYSRMDAGRLELTRVAFDLRSCVTDAAELLSTAAREKGLELSVHVDERLAERVVGDPNRLQQVLLNLGGNAVKFTPAGGILIRAAPVPGAAASVRFSVSDTGPGIPGDQRERIFEPFHQIDASSTRRHGGVGLGLTIARQLVELMGGVIGVEGEEGSGATFFFTAELPPVVEQRPRGAATPETLAGLRVLIVDDNATNRLVLREMLRAWKCVADEAADGWEALDKARAAAGTAQEFQLALVDYQMPEMDGSGFAREIKADVRLAQLPLVLLTSIPQHGEAARAHDEGFAAYLTKPVRQQLLLETLVGVLESLDVARRRSRLSLVQPGGQDRGA